MLENTNKPDTLSMIAIKVLEAAERRAGKIMWSGPSGPDPEKGFAYSGKDDDFAKLVNAEIDYLPEVINTNCSGAVMSIFLDAGLITIEQVRKKFTDLQELALSGSEERTSDLKQFIIWYREFKFFLGLKKPSKLFTEHTIPPDPQILFSIETTEFKLNSDLNRPGSLIFCHGIERSSSLVHIAISTGKLNQAGSPVVYSLESDFPWGKRGLDEVPLFSGLLRNHTYVAPLPSLIT